MYTQQPLISAETLMNDVPQNVIPPREAYLYVNPDHVHVRAGQKKGRDEQDRQVFHGWNNLTPFEKKCIQDLKEHVINQFSDSEYFQLQGLISNGDINEREILKFLQTYSFSIKKSVEALMEHAKWRVQNLPCKVTQITYDLLNSGLFYIYGRDKQFRPIFVFDMYVFQTQKSKQPELFALDNIKNACIFLMEYVKKNMFIPGQVEQWVEIINFNKLSLKDLPVNQVGAIAQVFQNNYMYVLKKAWVVNCTSFQAWCFKVFEFLVDQETRLKISFHNHGNPETLLSNVHPSQLEKRFGGTGPTPTRFFPPFMPEGEFGFDSSQQMTEEQKSQILKENPEMQSYLDKNLQIIEDDGETSFTDSVSEEMGYDSCEEESKTCGQKQVTHRRRSELDQLQDDTSTHYESISSFFSRRLVKYQSNPFKGVENLNSQQSPSSFQPLKINPTKQFGKLQMAEPKTPLYDTQKDNKMRKLTKNSRFQPQSRSNDAQSNSN